MADENQQPRLPIVKTALQAAWNDYRLDVISKKLDQQLKDAKNSGDRKAVWLIVEANHIELVEGVSPHPDAIEKLKEALLLVDSPRIEQQVGLELLMRSRRNATDIVGKLKTSPEMKPAELLAWAREEVVRPAITAIPTTADNSPVFADYAHQAALRRRLEKAQQRGDAKHEETLRQLLERHSVGNN